MRWHDLGILIPLLGSWGILHSRLPLTMKQIRAIEHVMMASLCVFKLTTDMFDIMGASRELDVAAIVGPPGSLRGSRITRMNPP